MAASWVAAHGDRTGGAPPHSKAGAPRTMPASMEQDQARMVFVLAPRMPVTCGAAWPGLPRSAGTHRSSPLAK
jgi:hypothetical protein